MINFTTNEKDKFTLVEFECGIATPKDIAVMNIPKANPRKGVVISGRGPIWIYGALVHEYHATAWVATNDPCVGGAVVVETHVPHVNVGDVIEL